MQCYINRFMVIVFLLVTLSGLCYGKPNSHIEKEIAQLPIVISNHLGLAFPGRQDKYYHVLQSAGLGIVRLGVTWQHREPRKGHYNWGPLDRQIIALQKLGIKPFLTLYSDAKWGVKSGRNPAKNKRPRDMIEWQKFVGALVERYDADGFDDATGLLAKVEFYQVANEWVSEKNKSGGWDGSYDELIDFINASYASVKKSDKDAIFVMGGIAAFNLDLMVMLKGMSDKSIHQKFSKNSSVTILANKLSQTGYIEKQHDIYRVLESSHYDYADVHLYGEIARNPYRVAAIKKHIGERPLLSSECGGPSLDYRDKYRPVDHFTAVLEWNLSSLALGLDYCLWFQLGEGTGSTWGNRKVALFDGKQKPKPGFFSYRLLANLLSDMKQVERLSEGLYKVSYYSAPPLLIAWQGKSQTLQHEALLNALDIPLKDKSRRSLSVLRVTDIHKGRYTVNKQQIEASLALYEAPLVISESLPKALYQ